MSVRSRGCSCLLWVESGHRAFYGLRSSFDAGLERIWATSSARLVMAVDAVREQASSRASAEQGALMIDTDSRSLSVRNGWLSLMVLDVYELIRQGAR